MVLHLMAVEPRGRRSKSCPRYKCKTAGQRLFSERSGGSLFPLL